MTISVQLHPWQVYPCPPLRSTCSLPRTVTTVILLTIPAVSVPRSVLAGRHAVGSSYMLGRRGRRSHDEQVEAVITLIRADIWTLKDHKAFADAIGVKALTAQFAGELWPLGIALHLLITGAIADVAAMAAASRTRTATRTAVFLRLWYNEHRTVTATARQLGLSRSHVAKTIQRPALVMVAQRVLALAQHADPASQSAGVERMVQRFKQHTEPVDPTCAASVVRRTPLPPALSA